jgi:hypothetical protein
MSVDIAWHHSSNDEHVGMLFGVGEVDVLTGEKGGKGKSGPAARELERARPHPVRITQLISTSCALLHTSLPPDSPRHRDRHPSATPSSRHPPVPDLARTARDACLQLHRGDPSAHCGCFGWCWGYDW